MNYNLDKTKMLSQFWKRRVDPYEPQGGHPIPKSKDDDYPTPKPSRPIHRVKTVLLWVAAAFGVLVLLAAIVVVPGLIM